jgi:hypothetical protein
MELCGTIGFMTTEELEITSVALFEECLQKVKRGEPVEAGFWLHRDGKLLFQKLGIVSEMMNSGAGKDRLFALMRIFIEGNESSNCFISTEAWEFVANEKADTVPGGWQSMVDKGFKKLVDGGYGKVYQSIWLTGQTEETVVLCSRRFEDMTMNGKRKIIFHGEMQKSVIPQAKFSGRAKMFGAFTEPEVEHFYNLFIEEILKKKTAGE